MAPSEIGVGQAGETSTETLVFRKKKNGEFNSGEWMKIVYRVKDVDGIIGQCWGPQLENPGLFVWVIDFQSLNHRQKFFSSSVYIAVLPRLSKLFQVTSDKDQPEFLQLTTQWQGISDEVNAAKQAAITEVAYFTVTSDKLSMDEAKKAIVTGLEGISGAVKTYGKAKGAAIGWVDIDEKTTLLHGIFGYDSLDDHLEWRKHPEHAKAGVAFAELSKRGVTLMPSDGVWGVDAERGYFHVEFNRT